MSALEAWRALESLFSQQSLAKVLQLKQQLQSLKKGSSTISEYFLKVKSIGNGLRAAGQAMSDRDVLLNVLNSLGHEYDPVVILVSQQHSISLLEAQYMLLIHEQKIDHLNSAAHVDVSPSANCVSNNPSNTNNSGNRNNNRGGQNNGGRNSGNRGRRGRGGRWNGNNKPVCQICSRVSHTIVQCYSRYDRAPPPQGHHNNITGSANHGTIQVQTQ
ncbi:hypothetical protein ACOSQ3_020434 [Xanthoceras sorbifolium]